MLEDHEGHEMAWPARDGAYVGATGLARGRSHAIWPWPVQEAYVRGKRRGGERDSGDMFLAKL